MQCEYFEISIYLLSVTHRPRHCHLPYTLPIMPTEFICSVVPKSGGNVNGSVWSWAGPPASSRSVDILVGVGVSLRRFFYGHWQRQLQAEILWKIKKYITFSSMIHYHKLEQFGNMRISISLLSFCTFQRISFSALHTQGFTVESQVCGQIWGCLRSYASLYQIFANRLSAG